MNLTNFFIENCYRGAQACVLAFSCVDRESFKCVAKWKKKVEEECGNIPMVLVMTKLDLLYRAEVDSFEVEKLSRQLGIRLIKTSVKENINVHKVCLFQELVFFFYIEIFLAALILLVQIRLFIDIDEVVGCNKLIQNLRMAWQHVVNPCPSHCRWTMGCSNPSPPISRMISSFDN